VLRRRTQGLQAGDVPDPAQEVKFLGPLAKKGKERTGVGANPHYLLR
jgi:hypothetical protein